MEGRAGGRVESRQEVFAMLLLFSNVIKDGTLVLLQTHVFIVQKRPTAEKFDRFTVHAMGLQTCKESACPSV
jgi:hypothetical protein